MKQTALMEISCLPVCIVRLQSCFQKHVSITPLENFLLPVKLHMKVIQSFPFSTTDLFSLLVQKYSSLNCSFRF